MSHTYDRATALIVADVQNDFADPQGSLYVPSGEQVVDVVNAEVERALEGGATVVYTQDWHPPRTPHFDIDGGTWPVHCVQGTWGAELHPRLRVEGEVVQKGVDGGDGYSGFSVRDPVSADERATRLGGILEDAGVERVVVTGLAGDFCVKATALDARELGYEVVLPLDATRFIDLEPGDGERVVAECEDAGVLVERP
jgi:nicotinamidase/pyrazinamidase